MAGIGDGTTKIFKPAIDNDRIVREIDKKSRILDADLKLKIRVANFHSVIISNDSTTTICLVFDFYLQLAKRYKSPECKMAVEDLAKWKQQGTVDVKKPKFP